MTDESRGVNANLIIERTAEIVAAYVRRNVVPSGDLRRLITEVYTALDHNMAGVAVSSVIEKSKPAVSVRKSIQHDHLTCLDCGQNFKSLKRHLATYHFTTPEDYRAKWDLASDYPMVAPAYAEERSILAKEMGLGLNHRRSSKSFKAVA